MKDTHTLRACFVGYIVQAIVNNFAPLLFLTFQSSFGISLSKITLLVSCNFGLQLVIDLLSAGFVDKIGYRVSAVLAHGCAAVGLVLLTVLPSVLPDPFVGLLIAVMIYAVGGGLLEVIVSPIVEACPTENKEKAMSLLHSFYCWGHVGVVLLSTLFFAVCGIEHWRILALLWAVIPLVNGVLFLRVPIYPLIKEGDRGFTFKELFRERLFWVFLLGMVCAGASEQAVSQWASAFAEQALGVDKTVGDLAGPMSFAVLMGLSRLLYGKYGEKIPLKRVMAGSGVLCVCSYLLIVFSPFPVLALVGCAICGFSVGILWPGMFSLASASLPRGGTLLFALLALGGDLGCMSGPTVVGFVSGALGDRLQLGILAGIVFPVALLGCVALLKKRKKN